VIIISSLDAPKSIRETEKNPKNPLVRVKKPKKTQKNPLGWVFLKKTRVFSNPVGQYPTNASSPAMDLNFDTFFSYDNFPTTTSNKNCRNSLKEILSVGVWQSGGNFDQKAL
jgi:hypothetical protein